MKKTYVNLVPVMAGGGLQNAINLIMGINDLGYDKNKFMFIIRNKTLEKILIEMNMKYIKVNNSFFSRLFYELFFFLGKKNNVIFTLFGGKPLLTYNNFTISGCAYSNLFYPEIDFWGYLSFSKKTIKKLKDVYRYYLIKFSDVIIFETDILKERAIKLKKFKENRTFVVKMAVNKIVSDSNRNSKRENFTKDTNKKFKILYLGSSHPNKRQHLLIAIARELKKKKVDLCFITTMQDNSYTKEFTAEIKREKLEEYISNIGPVDTSNVGELIKESDAMINIAKLESFSNNFIEAWTFKKLLILTDADWSKDSCKESAYYIDPQKPVETANRLYNLIEDKRVQEKLLNSYDKTLDSYLDYKEKTIKYIDLINKFSRGDSH